METLRKKNRSLEKYHTLVLNADYSPMQLINWRPAIESVVADKAYVVDEHKDIFVHSEHLSVPLPSVIVRKHFKDMFRPACLTRANVFTAYYTPDPERHGRHWVCGLCGERMTMADATFDHIVPRCKGGKSTWENLILAHASCNNRKGSRMLHEAGMSLKVHLFTPTDADLARQKMARFHESNEEIVPESWMDFIGDAYYRSQLDE